MKNSYRIILRLIVMIVSLWLIIFFHSETSKVNLMWMFVGLIGLLGVLFDYNYAFNHPVKFEDFE